MAEVIGVSEAQLRFVTNIQSGMGLMKCGNVVILFNNQIEKRTDLYISITPISMSECNAKGKKIS